MKRMMSWLGLLLLGISQIQAEPRTWTNDTGKRIQAEFGGVGDGQVKLILADGRQAAVPFASLSAEDQAWVSGQPVPVSLVSRIPAEKRRMPEQVKEPLLYTSLRVVREEPGDCLYESGHFQFKTTAKLGVALMKDVCRAFESTYELVRQMPWGIQPKPEAGRTKFQAELYETRQQYLATGAPSWSAGVYSLRDKVFRIPFGELGISDQPGAGGAYYRKGEINNDTITHEITHQMMHEYVPYMPAWLVEGLAEYTSNLPYRGGVYQVSEDGSVFETRSVKTSRRRGLFAMSQPKPDWVGVKKVWALTTEITRPNPLTSFLMVDEPAFPSPDSAPRPPSELNLDAIASHYHSGHLLTYFFVRDRDGLPLKKYFDALHAEIPKWPPFWKALDAYSAALEKLRPAYDAYEAEMKSFLQKPGVKEIGNGKISFPSNLTPPESPPQAPEPPVPPERTNPGAVCIKHLGILLDGRTLEQVEEEMRRMVQKLGYVF